MLGLSTCVAAEVERAVTVAGTEVTVAVAEVVTVAVTEVVTVAGTEYRSDYHQRGQ